MWTTFMHKFSTFSRGVDCTFQSCPQPPSPCESFFRYKQTRGEVLSKFEFIIQKKIPLIVRVKTRRISSHSLQEGAPYLALANLLVGLQWRLTDDCCKILLIVLSEKFDTQQAYSKLIQQCSSYCVCSNILFAMYFELIVSYS